MSLLSRLAAWWRTRRRALDEERLRLGGFVPGVEWPGPSPASPRVSQLTDGPPLYDGPPELIPPADADREGAGGGGRRWQPARFELDPETRVLDIHLAQGIPPGPVAETVRMLYAMVLVDLDDKGRVLGMELLDALPPGADIATAEEQ